MAHQDKRNDLAARPSGLLTSDIPLLRNSSVYNWAERYYFAQYLWTSLHPDRRTAFLNWLAYSNSEQWRTQHVQLPTLIAVHETALEELQFRTSRPFDLQAAQDDVQTGCLLDHPLELVARWHCAMDVEGPVAMRVSKTFQKVWQRALMLNATDIQRLPKKFRPLATESFPKKDEHEAPQLLFPEVFKDRRRLKQQWQMRDFGWRALSGEELLHSNSVAHTTAMPANEQLENENLLLYGLVVVQEPEALQNTHTN